MTPPTNLLGRADEDALRQCLASAIPDRCGMPSAITGIRWRRFELSTSYDTYVASAHLATGEELTVFVKDFGVSVRPKDGAKERREREIRVYRDLLPGRELGTARYYGSILDEQRERFWLLLEYVDGEPVGYCQLDAWAPAAAVLGRVHGHFASRADSLTRCDYLVQHTSEFFWSRAEDALHAVARIAPRQSARLEDLVRRYPPIVAIMASQPTTLVHGGCRPTNILINVVTDPSRACVVDWEEAGIGAPVFDLAHLLDGVQPPMLDRLLDAYCEEALACRLTLPSRRETKYLIECYRLYMIMNSLGRAVLLGYDEQAVAKLLGIAERIGHGVFLRRG